MRKLALAGIVSIFATVALSGCLSVPEEDTTVPAEGDTTPVVEETPDPTKYESNYGFELTFPGSWGEIEETVETGDDLFTANIILKSKDDEKEMMLYAIANAAEGDAYVMDAPAEKLGVGQTYTIYKEVNQGVDILEAQGEDVSEERALENELNQIAATFKTVEQEEGGGGIADCAADATVSEKLANFDNCSVTYEYGKDLIYGCNDEAKDLMAKMHAGKIKMLNTLVPNSTTLVLYKTENPDKLTKEEAKAIVQPCGELGSYQILDAADDYIILGYPNCSGGAIPDPELQPEQYAVWEDCIVVEKELKEYFEL